MAERAIRALENKLFGVRCPDCGSKPCWERGHGEYTCSTSCEVCHVVVYRADGQVVRFFGGFTRLRRLEET